VRSQTQPELFWNMALLQSPAPHSVQGRARGLISNGVNSQPEGSGLDETLTFRFMRCYRDYHSLLDFLITDYGGKGKIF